MSTEIPDNTGDEAEAIVKGPVILWDDECAICRRFKRWVDKKVEAKGYTFYPLRLWIETHPNTSGDGMHVVLPDGTSYFAVDAMLHVARLVWWMRPLRWISRLPGGRLLAAAGYRWFAARRYRFGGCACDGGRSSCRQKQQEKHEAD